MTHQLESMRFAWTPNTLVTRSMDALGEMIRAKIKSGSLPGALNFVNTWFGRGSGRQCIACERRIAMFEIEVEGDLQDGSVLYFHGLCYRTWEVEHRCS